MTAPISAPYAAGTSCLQFTRSGSDTVLTRVFATSPVKLIATRGRGAASWVYTATLGGGFVGGDEIRLTAEVGEGARALVTTQASTKVYRSRRRSTQHVTARVDADALLAVVPDPVVCFADADFAQRQHYDLHARASLVLVDWMTSGRHAAGERWAFSRYENRLDISRDARPLLADAMVLERNLDAVADRMRPFETMLTAVVTGPLVSDAAAGILHRISALPIETGGSPIVSAAALRDGGTLLRMAGHSVEAVASALRGHLSFLPPLVGDDLWSRKW